MQDRRARGNTWRRHLESNQGKTTLQAVALTTWLCPLDRFVEHGFLQYLLRYKSTTQTQKTSNQHL